MQKLLIVCVVVGERRHVQIVLLRWAVETQFWLATQQAILPPRGGLFPQNLAFVDFVFGLRVVC